MPQKPAAETQTPTAGEVAGNSELAPTVVQALTDDLATTQELALRQAGEIDELKAAVKALLEERAPKKKTDKPKAPPLPEGSKRYYSRHAEPLYVKEGAHKFIVDGQVVSTPQTGADFSGHVFQTSDPDIIEWLNNHPENGKSFWEDPGAIRSHSDVEIIEGVRGVDQAPTSAPRDPLSAPMG